VAVLPDTEIEIVVLYGGGGQHERWWEGPELTYPYTGAVGPDQIEERDHVAAYESECETLPQVTSTA
jgi:hypothetical protein